MIMTNTSKNKIESLQALRAIAFLGIFLNHAGMNIYWSELGVSVFFVLSAFLLYMKYEGTELDSSWKNCRDFACGKVSKIYPLHMITLIILFVYTMFGSMGRKRRLFCCIQALLHIFLVQSWVPDMTWNASYNGVAWYLSDALFLYFIFPRLFPKIKKISTSKLALICLVSLILQVVTCFPMLYFFENRYNTYLWYSYIFPIFRIPDMLMGCLAARLRSKIDTDGLNTWIISIIEIGILVIAIGLQVWAGRDISSIWLKAFQNYTTLYIPIAGALVLLFTLKKGLLTRILSNPVFVWIGNISQYLFLIHLVVIIFAEAIIVSLGQDIGAISTSYRIVLAVCELIVTIALSLIYQKAEPMLVNSSNRLLERIGIHKK